MAKLGSRLEIRVDNVLLKSLEKFCSEMRQPQSSMIRDAIQAYMRLFPIKELLVAGIHREKNFNELFQETLQKVYDSGMSESSKKILKDFLEFLLGPDEEAYINSMPKNFLDKKLKENLVTKRGLDALKNRIKT